jgi:ribosomal protein L37AE/L43A
MTETKRRQGQRGATPKPICPKCGEYLKRAYVGIGWSCPSVTCDHMIKDFVELEDIEEGAEQGTDKKEKIKQLTAEFVKTHEQLNKLTEQINELEKE